MVPEEPNDSRQEDKTGPLVQTISEIISKRSRDTGPETMKEQEETQGERRDMGVDKVSLDMTPKAQAAKTEPGQGESGK